MPRVTDFAWDWWNAEHVTKHGCDKAEAEHVVRWGRARKTGKGKWMVEGLGNNDRLVRVIFVLRSDDGAAYIIHAMPLTTRRRRRKR